MDALVKWKTGWRRKLACVPSRSARWPGKSAQRRKLLEAWCYVAKQVLRSNRVNLCLLPALVASTEWIIGSEKPPDGIITASNKQLAKRSGCSVITVARLLDHYVNLGLLTRETVLERRKDGTIRPKRTLRPAFPEHGLEYIMLPDEKAGPCDTHDAADTWEDAPDNLCGFDDDWAF